MSQGDVILICRTVALPPEVAIRLPESHQRHQAQKRSNHGAQGSVTGSVDSSTIIMSPLWRIGTASGEVGRGVRRDGSDMDGIGWRCVHSVITR